MILNAGALEVAKEAVKPFSSVIDALLAPKVRRIREWAADRDLDQRVDGVRLGETFRTYLAQLLRRVSSVQTLVFPQRPLELPAIYEPLTLVRHKGRAAVVGKRDAAPWPDGEVVPEIALSRPRRRTYIVDAAGMGKSTFARNLVLSEVIHRDRIPLLLELRRIQKDESLLDALARDLDQLHKQFDREMFLSLLAVGDFLIILDGLDEVASERRATLSAEIEDLSTKAERSAIVLTSRPEIPLPTFAGGDLLAFAALTDDQSKSLVRRYDEIGQIQVGERLIARFSTLPAEFLRTPLLVALLYRSFGYNGDVSPKVSSFYDELYDALYKGHDLTKTSFARPKESGLDVDAFRRLLRGFAFVLTARQATSLPSSSQAVRMIDEARRLTGVRPHSSRAFLDDLLVAVPLMLRDGSEIRFVHKTICEYFAAEHMAYGNDGEELAEMLSSSAAQRLFSTTIEFYSELQPMTFKRIFVAPIAEEFLEFRPELGNSPVRTMLYVAPRAELFIASGEVEQQLLRRSDEWLVVKFGGEPSAGDPIILVAMTGPPPPASIGLAAGFLTMTGLAPEDVRSIRDALSLSASELGGDGREKWLNRWISVDDPNLQATLPGIVWSCCPQAAWIYCAHGLELNMRSTGRLHFDPTRAQDVLAELRAESASQIWLRTVLRLTEDDE